MTTLSGETSKFPVHLRPWEEFQYFGARMLVPPIGLRLKIQGFGNA